MYAIIQTGGKQYRVESGDVLDVELDAKSDGESVEFDNVLLVGDGDRIQVASSLRLSRVQNVHQQGPERHDNSSGKQGR